MRHKAAVTFVTRYKSNQKNFERHSATVDGLKIRSLIRNANMHSDTVTALKAKQIYQASFTAYGHSLASKSIAKARQPASF
jgi:hypothetical protein